MLLLLATCVLAVPSYAVLQAGVVKFNASLPIGVPLAGYVCCGSEVMRDK